MAIKIQTQTPSIPIEIGDLKLKFDMTDENIKRLYDSKDEVEKELETIDDSDFEGMKKVLNKSIDFLLGKGTFDKIYDVSPSVIIIAQYFWQIIEGLEVEIMKKAGNTQQAKVQKYLQNKNRQNRNRNNHKRKK